MTTLINYLKTSASKHVFGLVIAAGIVLVGYSWITEHDARILAEQTVKQSQDRIANLQQQSEAIQKAGDAVVAKLKAQRESVKTPTQAIAALPSVSPEPLSPAALPDAPSRVAVDAVPLFQTLNQCKECSAELATDNAELAIDKEVQAEKDTEIKALKKKPAFWHRVARTAEVIGIGAAIGYAAHR